MKGGPPFSVDRAEVDQLYAANFSIRELARIDLIAESPKFAEVGIAALDEVAYALTRTRG
jgi:thiopurine S-methyltransferase